MNRVLKQVTIAQSSLETIENRQVTAELQLVTQCLVCDRSGRVSLHTTLRLASEKQVSIAIAQT